MGEQLSMFESSPVASTQVDCRFPHLASSKAFYHGCRCLSCKSWKKRYDRQARQNKATKQCVVDGCEQARHVDSKMSLCREHHLLSLPRLECSRPGCSNPRSIGQGNIYCDVHKIGFRGICKLDDCFLERWVPDGRKAALIYCEAHSNQLLSVQCELCDKTEWADPRTKRKRFCRDCRHRFSHLLPGATKHNVPLAMLVQFMRNPSCRLCSQPLNIYASRHHVDHDHDCCPGPFGCEECVRGFLCKSCNLGLGHAEKMLRAFGASQLVEYINSRRAA